MVTKPETWNLLFAHQGRLALDKGFASALRESGYLHQGNVEAVAREYLRYVYLDHVMPGGATASKAALSAAAAVGGIPGFPGRVPGKEGQETSYESTLDAYRAEFGEPPDWFWPSDPARGTAARSRHPPAPHLVWFTVFVAGLAGLFASFVVHVQGHVGTSGLVAGLVGSACMLLGGGLGVMLTEPRHGSGAGSGGSGSSDSYGSYGGDAALAATCASVSASVSGCSVSDGGCSASY